MVSKEDCKDAINNFIKTNDIKYAVILLDYLCQVKEIIEKENTINSIVNNPITLSMVLPRLLEELERHFSLIRVTDKNNNLILVY